MIPLYATALATRALAGKHPEIHPTHYRLLDDVTVSSIGFGTRLGAADDSTDALIAAALRLYLSLGGNIIDTAAHDRQGRSERTVGAALAAELSTGKISRREIVVVAKGGFLTVQERDNLLHGNGRGNGLSALDANEVAGGIHCIAPAYIRHRIDASRENMQLEVIDLYLLHNPEAQARFVDRETFLARIRRAVECLEEAASDGVIKRYGIASWSGFCARAGEPDHLELAEIVGIAESVAGKRHHLCALQVPYNVLIPSAAFAATQLCHGNTMSILEAAHELGIDVIAATPLMGGDLADDLPAPFHHAFPRFGADALRALDFVLSTPWVAAAMVGMSNPDNLRHNMEMLGTAALESLQWAAEIDQLKDYQEHHAR